MCAITPPFLIRKQLKREPQTLCSSSSPGWIYLARRAFQLIYADAALAGCYLVVVSALDEAALDGGLPHEVLSWLAAADRHRQHPGDVFHLHRLNHGHPSESGLSWAQARSVVRRTANINCSGWSPRRILSNRLALAQKMLDRISPMDGARAQTLSIHAARTEPFDTCSSD